MNIEKLCPDNLAAITHLSLELWPDCTFPDQEIHYKNMLDSDRMTCYAIKHQSIYLGFIELSLRRDYVEGSETSPTAYVEGIYIKATHRHQGLGRELIKMAERWAGSHGLHQLASDVEIMNKSSMDFHRSLGFKEVNRVVFYMKDID